MCYWGAIIKRQNGNGNGVENVALKKNGINGVKFDEAKKTAYIELIREGHDRAMAARGIGISLRTVERHMLNSDELREAVSLAETEVNQKVENALYETAMSGNVTAIQVWLYNRDPKRWADKRNIQLAGEGGGPIEVEHSVKDLTDEELLEIILRERDRGISKETPSP